MFRTILTASTVLCLLSGPALAQAEDNTLAAKAPILEGLPAQSDSPAPDITEFIAGQGPGQLLATDILGLAVYDSSGTTIGSIVDVLMEEDSQIAGIVLDASELMATGKRVAFPLENLRHEAVGSEIRLVAALTREAIEAAPDFASLGDEMMLNDGQSLTTEQTDGETVTVEPSQ